MPLYIKLSTEIKDDDKLNKAGPAAAWLWLRGLAWSKERLTDGFVAEGALPILCTGLGPQRKLVDRLVQNKLWTKVSGGYTVGAKRWAKHQTTKEQVEAVREKWNQNKRFQRARRELSTEDNPRTGDGVHGGHMVEVSSTRPSNVRAPENRDQRSEIREQSAEGGKPPSPPRGVLSQDADRPDMAVPVREAMRALERWSHRDRGSGLDAVHGEFQTAEDRCTNGWQCDTPIIHAGEPVNPVALVPLAVERIMGKPNPPAFKSVKFALGCVNTELADMRARGTQGDPSGKPRKDFDKILGGAA